MTKQQLIEAIKATIEQQKKDQMLVNENLFKAVLISSGEQFERDIATLAISSKIELALINIIESLPQ